MAVKISNNMNLFQEQAKCLSLQLKLLEERFYKEILKTTQKFIIHVFPLKSTLKTDYVDIQVFNEIKNRTCILGKVQGTKQIGKYKKSNGKRTKWYSHVIIEYGNNLTIKSRLIYIEYVDHPLKLSQYTISLLAQFNLFFHFWAQQKLSHFLLASKKSGYDKWRRSEFVIYMNRRSKEQFEKEKIKFLAWKRYKAKLMSKISNYLDDVYRTTEDTIFNTNITSNGDAKMWIPEISLDVNAGVRLKETVVSKRQYQKYFIVDSFHM